MQFRLIMLTVLASLGLGFGINMLLLPVPMAVWLAIQWVIETRR